MIKKTKTDYHITLSEAKKHLRIDEFFAADDDMIAGLIEAAVRIAENYIENDIAYTNCVMTLPDYVGSDVIITEGNLIQVTGVTAGTTVVNIDDIRVIQYSDYFIIELPNHYDCTDSNLIVEYISGFEELDKAIRSAILMYLGDLYDVDRSNYTFKNYSYNATAERILNYYKAIYFKYYRQ